MSQITPAIRDAYPALAAIADAQLRPDRELRRKTPPPRQAKRAKTRKR